MPISRHGQLEDRDPYRLKDRNGEPVICFCCSTSALPPGLAADSPIAKRARRSTANVNNYETGRAIISCDYCHLHWHLDCLEPPMIIMPPWSKKWMCPNHAEQTSVSIPTPIDDHFAPFDDSTTWRLSNQNVAFLERMLHRSIS